MTNPLDALYQEAKGLPCPPESRLEFLGEHVFEFTTCDGDMDARFAGYAIEVGQSILEGKTFEYQRQGDVHYERYLLMVNMSWFASRIDWGTSIRGCWFNPVAKAEMMDILAFAKEG